jgi:hypothetical protein
MSRSLDAVRGRRRRQKGRIAEGPEALMLLDSGHIVKNYMAVIARWRATQNIVHDIDRIIRSAPKPAFSSSVCAGRSSAYKSVRRRFICQFLKEQVSH